MESTTTMKSKNWMNILLLGFGFLMLFTAFQTAAFVQSITIDSFLSPSCRHLNKSDPSATPSTIKDGGITITDAFAKRIGYISLCIIYLMVAVGNWVSVPIVAVFGSKWSLVVTGALYVIYIIALIRPYIPTIFFAAFVLGSAGGVLWTAQGQILIQNSTKSMMSVTSGIFWFMLQCSLIIGNLFIFSFLYIRRNVTHQCIEPLENYIIFGVFTVMGIIGVILFVFLLPVRRQETSALQRSAVNDRPLPDFNDFMFEAGSGLGTSETKALLAQGTEDKTGGVQSAFREAGKSLVKAIKILISKDMLLLSVTFVYTGYELNFWSGVYGTVIGHTQQFSYWTIGLAGLFIGIGEIVGGALFGILGKYTNRYGKDPIVLLGMLVHFVTFLLVFYNLPSRAISADVSAKDSYGYLFQPSNIYIAITCALLLGFGDACFNTQIYAIIGTLYPNDDESAPAMALFKFFQSLAAMVGFLTSTLIHLQWQLLVLVVLATAGTLTFAIVEWKHYKQPQVKK